MSDSQDRLRLLESEIERRLVERFAALRDEFDHLRLESDHRWAGFLERFDQDFRGIVPPELVAEPERPEPPPPPPPSGLPDRPAGAGLLSIEVARSLDDAGNQVEALHRFLELCRRHASRAALLIAKGDSFAVWKATGFSDHGGNDEAVRRVILPLDGGVLSKVIEGAAYRLDASNQISSRLGAEASSAVLVPMVVKEKVSGAVYADTTSDESSRFDPESIAFLTFLAGLFVDRLAARKLKPAPALRPLESFGATAASAPPPDAEAEAESKTAGSEPAAPDLESSTPSAEEPAPRSKPRDSYGTQILSAEESAAIRRGAASHPVPPEPAPQPRFVEESPAAPSSTHQAEEPSLQYEADEEPARVSDTSSVVAEAAAPRAPEPQTPPPAPAPPPVAPVAPSRPAPAGRRLAGPLAPAEGDERRDEARRFAKLLVSEIKLYNEKSVQEGRQRGDIYERLKEDIDRSRQMYDERIPEDVRSSSNFFYEELVRILADGRAEALGI